MMRTALAFDKTAGEALMRVSDVSLKVLKKCIVNKGYVRFGLIRDISRTLKVSDKFIFMVHRE